MPARPKSNGSAGRAQRLLVLWLLAAGPLGGCTALPFIKSNAIDDGQRQVVEAAINREEPFEIAGPVHALEPAPTPRVVDEVFFSPTSRSFVWFEGEAGQPGLISAAEVSGAKRTLGSHNGSPRVLDWSADGSRVLIDDYNLPQRPDTLGSLKRRPMLCDLSATASPPLVIGEFQDGPEGITGPGLRLLPGAEACWEMPIVNMSGNPGVAPTYFYRFPRQMFVIHPGAEPQLETTLGGPGEGRWSADGTQFAYMEWRDGDPVKGLAVKAYDRSTRATRTLIQLETDDVAGVSENLSWLGSTEVFLTTICQTDGSASIQVSSVTVNDQVGHMRFARFSMEKGERLGEVSLSPDKQAVAFELLAQDPVIVDGVQVGDMARSHGVYLAVWPGGTVSRLLPRGHIVSWLPGSHELICSTGLQDQTRFYRVEVPSGTGGR